MTMDSRVRGNDERGGFPHSPGCHLLLRNSPCNPTLFVIPANAGIHMACATFIDRFPCARE